MAGEPYKSMEELTEELNILRINYQKELEARKKLVQAIRVSEHKFRTVFDASPIGIAIYDSDGKPETTNHICLEMFAVSDQSGLPDLNLLKKDFLTPQEKTNLDAGRTAKCEFKWEFGGPNATDAWKVGTIYVDALINPINRPANDGSKGYLVHFQDITKRKKAQESLMLNESRFREIYENCAVMMHSINQGGIILNVNRKWLSELGYTREEVLGRKVDLIMTHESAHRAFSKILPKYWKEGKVSDVEYQYVKKDGTIIDVLLDSVVMSDPVWGIISMSVTRNVTDRKRTERELLQSEERFRALFEGAHDCIFIKDGSLRYTHINPEMSKLLGIPREKMLGLTAEDVHGEEAARHIREVDLRVLGGESIEEEHSRTINSVELTFHDIRIPLRDSRNEIIGVCGILRNVTERKKATPAGYTSIVKDYPSAAMQATFSKARYAAAADSIVLLMGESGSGKDYLARWIHDHSKRAKGPFFAINCAAVPHELAESELFGHESGAFTGARGRKRGLLELAEGGTLLLNEIGELPLSLQSKLLTFLDTRSFPRVGGEKQVRVNARLIAATHRDLKTEVDTLRFLPALYYRLNVFTIMVPPLRERAEDVPVLIDETLARLASEMQLNEIPAVAPSVIEKLINYSWPGNVRELRNVLERALMLSTAVISDESLPLMDEMSGTWCRTVVFPTNKSLYDITDTLAYDLCTEALRRADGQKKSAAKLLGISRDTFYRFLKKNERQ